MNPLRLHAPLNDLRTSQRFGSNNACLTPSGKVVPKFLGLFRLPWNKDFYKFQGLLGHTGEDYKAKTGDYCFYAGPDGEVVEIQLDPARGIGVGVVTKYIRRFGC